MALTSPVYAQWRSEDDFRAILGDDGARKHMDALVEIGATAEPGLCRAVSLHSDSTAGASRLGIGEAHLERAPPTALYR